MKESSLLLQLPSEILEHIIYVASKIPRNDPYQFSTWQYPEHSYTHLKYIALTCRKLYILCTPYLWRDKEFILPAESDKPGEASDIQMATDILSEQAALFRHLSHLGCYVRSLCRDLTNSPYYDLPDSCLMAQLVCNLRALRVDWHPKPRTEHYGLCYFSQHCPSLSELYLENCRDTFDDFYTLVHYKRRLRSLTLLNCTIKADTLVQLCNLARGSLHSLLLQQVWIEPIQKHNNDDHHTLDEQEDTTTINNLTTSYLHSNSSTLISPLLYTHILASQINLTRLALSDSVSMDILDIIADGSPHLERLAITLHERHPSRVVASLFAISRLNRLTLLSLAFRYATNIIHERLACSAPARYWPLLIQRLNRLEFLHVSASQLLLEGDFIVQLLQPSFSLKRIMFHHVALVSPPRQQQPSNNWDSSNQDILHDYEQDLELAQNTIESWQRSTSLWQHVDGYILSLEQAERKRFTCFYSTDKVCFVKGFDDGA
ncbi:hypothetical protein BC941DRAFT_431084 [Chlamydoabsidia padenii]|nr:hypothetical protein BC941DRAFT_431084 [Chlamydoabsidia padenii]